ncbi:hypothetical protein Bca52824_023357 [Brassica carinata]|uniref:Uncharacterized protein n=1 Tax=Brassica carinata TaxID=52824 RepID=A0A8X8ASZ2_BRACI|nr:hypothetical protein Bca52824_023357 [Brassica carinata]
MVLSQDVVRFSVRLYGGLAIGAIFAATDSVGTMQGFDLTHLNHEAAFHFLGNFLYLFLLSTVLSVATGLISAYVIKKLYFGRHSTD